MNLKEQRAAALKAAQDVVDAAKKDGRDLTEDEQATVEAKFAEVEDLDAKIKAAEKGDALMAKLNSLGPVHGDGDVDAKQAKNLGEHFAAKAGKRLAEAKGNGGRWSIAAPEFKASSDTQTVGSVFEPVYTQIDTNIVQQLRRRLTVADLLGFGTLSGAAIAYFVEGDLQGDFGDVAEAGAKGQIHYADPTKVTESLHKIAAFIKESDEMTEDLPFLVSAINNRLIYNLGLYEEKQLVNGTGELKGILQRTGVQTEASASADDDPDAIFRAMTSVSTGSGLDADALVINPTDYQRLRLSKDSNGQYFGGGFFSGEYGNGGVTAQPPLWGLRTVVTPAVAEKTAVVGSFKQAATLYRKGGVRVEATNSHDTDFTHNLVTIRAEERVALAVRVPAGFVNVTLFTATSG
jgi:HK97 family phage major capsid protein